MSEQNRYRIASCYRTKQGAESGWIRSFGAWSGATWQDAIRKRLDDIEGIVGSYQVVSETPSEDGRSGVIETQFDPTDWWVGAQMKATIIED